MCESAQFGFHGNSVRVNSVQPSRLGQRVNNSQCFRFRSTRVKTSQRFSQSQIWIRSKMVNCRVNGSQLKDPVMKFKRRRNSFFIYFVAMKIIVIRDRALDPLRPDISHVLILLTKTIHIVITLG
ncbi:hypothetical protein Hdeb2414_s0006g00213881 [Helianthus debilis subsp. tardiflorus]